MSQWVIPGFACLYPDRKDFFQLESGVHIPAGLVIEANWLLSQAVFSSKAGIVRGYESLWVSSTIDVPSDFERSSEELVLHFRGTDQIGHIWRPPPLAYFEKAVLHAAAERVRIVTDDPESSLVQELRKRLERLGAETILQSKDIQQDMAAILLARTFCLGIGSFSSGLAGLSSSLETAYSWAQPDWSGWTKFYGTFDVRPDIRNLYVSDPSGRYVRFFRENKTLSVGQIVRHMKEFRVEDLEVRNPNTTFS